MPDLPDELLVSQLSWLRRLAFRLVADEDVAEEVVQETMALAVEHPPQEPDKIRGWLRKVARNLFHERLRSGDSRVARERAAARDEATAGMDELTERVHLQRRIADALLSLDEPSRKVILLRFYEDLPPRAIARRLDEPVATVKSRIRRALGKLRSRLDDEYGGDRQAWALVLVPWVRDLAPAAAPTIGGIAMGAKAWVAAGAVAVAGAWVWLANDGAEPATRVALEGPVLPEPEAPRPSGRALPGTPAPPPAEREVVAPAAAGPGTPPVEGAAPAAAETHVARGRVFDAEGRPVAFVDVRLREGGDAASTGPDGSFELRTPLAAGRLEVADERWVEVRTGSWRASGRIEPVLVVAPAVDLAGFVVDEWGRRLEGARIGLAMPQDFESRFDAALDSTIQEFHETVSDEGGAFALERAPAVAGAELRAVLDGYAPHVAAAPLESRSDLWIELRAPLVTGEGLRGRVLRDDGNPATNALVSMGNVTVTADDQGFFRIDLARAERTERLRAVEAGFRPGEMERPGEPGDGDDGWPDYVELRLGPPALTIEGRVVRADGTPLSDGRVWVGDPQPFGVLGSIPLTREALMAGGSIPPEAIDSLAEIAAADGPQDYGSASPIFAPNAILSWVETDGDGRFVLGGLDDRDYTLHALGDGLHWGAVAEGVPAGARNAEIVVPMDVAWERLAGRIVTERGDPVPGVTISTWIAGFHAVAEVEGGTSDVLRFFMGKSATSDDEGRFELFDVPREHVQFHLISDDITPSYTSVDAVTDPEDFVVQVLARVHCEVIAGTGPDAPTRMRVEDALGRPVTILEMRADGYSNYQEFPLTDGRSGVVTLTSDAAVLKLLRDGEVVRTVPLRLRPGEVTTIRP